MAAKYAAAVAVSCNGRGNDCAVFFLGTFQDEQFILGTFRDVHNILFVMSFLKCYCKILLYLLKRTRSPKQLSAVKRIKTPIN